MRQRSPQPHAALFSWISCVTVLLSLFLRPTTAERLAKRDEINYFYNPPASGSNADFSDNVAFVLGSLIDLAFVTDFPTVSLQICQQYGTESATCAELFREQSKVTQIQWRVSMAGTGFDLSASQIFYFEVFNGDFSSTETFTSHYFYIHPSGTTTTQSVVTATINPAAVTASSSSAAPILQTFTMTPDLTLQAGVASAAPSASTSIPTTSASTTSNPSAGASGTGKPNSGGLSSGAKIGIGVGVGVGVLCLALGALIGFCFWRRGRQKSAEQLAEAPGFEAQQYEPYHGGSSGYPSGFSVEPKYAPVQQWGPHGELPAHEHPQELHGARSPTQELPGSQPFRRENI